MVPCQSSPWRQWFYFLVKFSSAHCARVFTVLFGFHLWSGTTGSQPIHLVLLRCKLCFLELVGVEPHYHLPYSRLHIWVVLPCLAHIFLLLIGLCWLWRPCLFFQLACILWCCFWPTCIMVYSHNLTVGYVFSSSVCPSHIGSIQKSFSFTFYCMGYLFSCEILSLAEELFLSWFTVTTPRCF